MRPVARNWGAGMKLFTLLTRQTCLDGERRELFDAITEAGHRCAVVNPNHCAFEFKRGEPLVIRHSAGDLAETDYLLARATTGCRPAAYVMAASLWYLTTCAVVDPISRYQCEAGKMKDAIDLHRDGRSIDTWLIFSDVGLEQIINELPYPVLAKPHKGSHGEGIVAIDNPTLLRHHVIRLLSESANYPVYIQRYMNFTKQYRYLFSNYKTVGVFERQYRNSFSRSKKLPATDYPELPWIPGGICGVDVGVTNDGKVYIIEINYAPEWSAMQRVTGKQVAREIIECITGGNK